MIHLLRQKKTSHFVSFNNAELQCWIYFSGAQRIYLHFWRSIELNPTAQIIANPHTHRSCPCIGHAQHYDDFIWLWD